LVRALDLEQPFADGSARGDAPEADARDLANQPPVVRYVNLLVREAYEARASDIHVEAALEGPLVRFRIDGVLTEATAPPRMMQAAVLSRLKLIADLDIAERRVPQDGRIRVRLDHQDLDLRVSTMPTLHGESIVLRLLDRHAAPEGLEALGMDTAILESFIEAVKGSHGIVLTTGPTGSGKTTTLYAALQLRDSHREKIITIEDPIEYRLTEVTQVPVNVKAGMTFASGLRSILRQDPDVIMVGEMRDAETARIAVQAAMTGHVVFSTIHTNDAAGAVTRLLDLGIEPYLVAATLRAVLAQRLVRRSCSHCGEWVAPDESFSRLTPVADSDQECFVGTGCAVCRQTGFHGRLGLFELMEVGEEIRRRIATSPDAGAVRTLAVEQGMRTMTDDGRRKVLAGVTTPAEVLRAIQT
jgi:general secretion pathway protein E